MALWTSFCTAVSASLSPSLNICQSIDRAIVYRHVPMQIPHPELAVVYCVVGTRFKAPLEHPPLMGAIQWITAHCGLSKNEWANENNPPSDDQMLSLKCSVCELETTNCMHTCTTWGCRILKTAYVKWANRPLGYPALYTERHRQNCCLGETHRKKISRYQRKHGITAFLIITEKLESDRHGPCMERKRKKNLLANVKECIDRSVQELITTTQHMPKCQSS